MLPDIDALVSDPDLNRMTPEEFDALPYGAIRLDADNRVTVYNASEAELARRDRAATLGRNFFAEVAPCTDNPQFRGRLEALLSARGQTAAFEYRFLFPWGHRDVQIRLWVAAPDQRWIFVVPRGGVARSG